MQQGVLSCRISAWYIFPTDMMKPDQADQDRRSRSHSSSLRLTTTFPNSW